MNPKHNESFFSSICSLDWEMKNAEKEEILIVFCLTTGQNDYFVVFLNASLLAI